MKFLLIFLLSTISVAAQDLPSRWDELTASDWPKAQEKAAYTCILPIGILEKHGPHLPMGSDLIHVRELAARAAKQEYAVVFPISSTARFSKLSTSRALSRCRPA